jgi:hypothetical protein
MIPNEEHGVSTSNERCKAKSNEALPQVALLLQQDEDAIDQIVIGPIVRGSGDIRRDTGSFGLCPDEGGSLVSWLFVDGFFGWCLAKILCFDQTSCYY